MRLLDVESDAAVTQAQLYLTERESRELVAQLTELLEDPETLEHHHLFSDDGGCEVSCSIVTASKLRRGYTDRENRLLLDHK